MPPLTATSISPSPSQASNIITLNVGGRLFQTTLQTLSLAGPTSLLSSLQPNHHSPPFIDRDPDLFSPLLSLLRTGTLPSSASSTLHDLISESNFYNLQTLLLTSLSNPNNLDPFNLHRSLLLPLPGRDTPSSSLSTTPLGSLHVAHGSKVSTFTSSLQKKTTLLTHFTAIDSLHSLNENLAALGAVDFNGLHIIDLDSGLVKKRLLWEGLTSLTSSSSTVQAIGGGDKYLFVSFESGRRNENVVAVYDVETLNSVVEIGRNEICGADYDNVGVFPATKLSWIGSLNLLMASGAHSGPSGVRGSVKLWDVRCRNVVWELKEKEDCFADVTVSDAMGAIFKVGVCSGEVFAADLRHLGGVEPWVCLGEKSIKVAGKSGKREGVGCRIGSFGNQVFCSKGARMEMWSEVMIGAGWNSEDGLEGERVFRSNVMGRAKDLEGSKVTGFAFGGNKMFVTRKDEQFVEVWQSSGRRF